MTKHELRKIYTAKRTALSDKEYLEYNEQVCERFFKSIELKKIKILHSFLPLIRRREVDTMMIINRLQEELPEIKVVIPRMKSGEEIESLYYEGPSQLMINSWGIQEPKQGEIVDPLMIDLVLVPLLAFDVQGNRVGYGKGYYDRFLRQCRKDCLKIGLSMFEPEEKVDGVSVRDFRLDKVITPEEAFTF
jgi:5-formyltetrahydrofolate cyclo-ligase